MPKGAREGWSDTSVVRHLDSAGLNSLPKTFRTKGRTPGSGGPWKALRFASAWRIDGAVRYASLTHPTLLVRQPSAPAISALPPSAILLNRSFSLWCAAVQWWNALSLIPPYILISFEHQFGVRWNALSLIPPYGFDKFFWYGFFVGWNKRSAFHHRAAHKNSMSPR